MPVFHMIFLNLSVWFFALFSSITRTQIHTERNSFFFLGIRYLVNVFSHMVFVVSLFLVVKFKYMFSFGFSHFCITFSVVLSYLYLRISLFTLPLYVSIFTCISRSSLLTRNKARTDRPYSLSLTRPDPTVR